MSGAASRRKKPAAARVVEANKATSLVPWQESGAPAHAALSLDRILRDYLQLAEHERNGGGVSPHKAMLQHTVEGLLARVVAGEDPRAVFKLQPKRQGRPIDERRPAAMYLEFLRLRLEHQELSESAARELVATEFDVTLKTVERAIDDWAPVLRPETIRQYVAAVHAEGLVGST